MRRTVFVGITVAGLGTTALLLQLANTPSITTRQIEDAMTTTSVIVTDVNNFVASQNQNRGQSVYGGGTVSLDYNALTGIVPTGGNSVTGISGIASGAATITLPSSQVGNTVIIDGRVSTSASTSGTDSYSFLVATDGSVAMTDNNTGNSQTITGASYLVFDGGATTSTGAYQSTYMVETGVLAQISSMYNAAFQRVPDFAGLEFNAIPVINGVLSLHQTAVDFLNSPEFKKLYPALTAVTDNGGPNDQAFITELYGNILHRTPTVTEVAYYVNALQGTLTTSTGATIPAADRAQLLIYFSISPENQADISASNGGWLINPTNGVTNFGAPPSISSGTLGNAVASGSVNTALFAAPTAGTDVTVGLTSIVGGGTVLGGLTVQNSEISTADPNITIDLSANVNVGTIEGQNDVLNGYSGGGSLIIAADLNPGYKNNGGTVNLFGNTNTIESGGHATGVTVATVVNGWNGTDRIIPNGGASVAGTLYSGSASAPISGSSITFTGQWIEVNIGAVADDSATSMATAASAAYKVADVASEKVVFVGQDTNSNTMIYHWGGDTSGSHAIAATDFTGAVELSGIYASTLTNANFH